MIDKPILDLLNITEETQLSVSTDGRSLVISPTDSKRKTKFEATMNDTFSRYGRMLKRLAE